MGTLINTTDLDEACWSSIGGLRGTSRENWTHKEVDSPK